MTAAQIKRLLPSVFQDTADARTPLRAILDVMEAMHAPSESVLDHLETYFDPYRAPDAFVPFLASWVDLESVLDCPRASGPSRDSARVPSLSTGIGRLRELTAAAVSLSKWRGTRKGLSLFLETATGVSGFLIDEVTTNQDGKPVPFHIRITAPAAAAEHRTLIARIVELEKPAYVTSDLRFAPPAPEPPTFQTQTATDERTGG